MPQQLMSVSYACELPDPKLGNYILDSRESLPYTALTVARGRYRRVMPPQEIDMDTTTQTYGVALSTGGAWGEGGTTVIEATPDTIEGLACDWASEGDYGDLSVGEELATDEQIARGMYVRVAWFATPGLARDAKYADMLAASRAADSSEVYLSLV